MAVSPPLLGVMMVRPRYHRSPIQTTPLGSLGLMAILGALNLSRAMPRPPVVAVKPFMPWISPRVWLVLASVMVALTELPMRT